MKRLLLVLAACSSDGRSPDAHASTEGRVLGLNDVSILLPLPATTTAPVLAKMTGLVPGDLFERLVVAPNDTISKFEEFHIVAVRFDLCDRPAPGACPAGDDGRLRIVYQPLGQAIGQTSANDVALHAFYPIPNAELGAVVDELRRIAAIANTPVTAALRPATPSVTYADALRTLVMRYAGEEKLLRLTLFAQNAMTASLNWAFRGEERASTSAAFAPIRIPAIAQVQQRTILVGGDTTYDTMPIADAPAGFALALDSAAFGAADPAARMQALEAMAQIQNPLTHSAETVQCVGCHVTTFLTARRAAIAGIDPQAISGRYASSFDLSAAVTNNRSLRAFGYLFDQVMISQRVVNDTAQVLVEIEARFPPAMP
jgi:hypothetical protein